MCGNDYQPQSGMFIYAPFEGRIPVSLPLRGVRKLVDAVLTEMSKDFDGPYANVGRPLMSPERLLRALLLRETSGRCRPYSSRLDPGGESRQAAFSADIVLPLFGVRKPHRASELTLALYAGIITNSCFGMLSSIVVPTPKC
jgi:hypothetical protein